MNRAIDERTVDPDPFTEFERWFQIAEVNVPLHNAMTLATVSSDGAPSARMVLLKHADRKGFVFYTNYQSRKGKELDKNPRAALVFHWQALEIQVRIEGSVERVAEQDSDAYFRSRPRDSQVSAWASPQGAYLSSREELERLSAACETKLAGDQIPRPSFWGGYRVIPCRIEFWHAREARLHDRIVYERLKGAKWTIKRLAP